MQLPLDLFERRTRTEAAYRRWRAAVLVRDGFRCQRCGAGHNLQAHHRLPWAQYPGDRFDVANGITVCKTCHVARHRLARVS